MIRNHCFISMTGSVVRFCSPFILSKGLLEDAILVQRRAEEGNLGFFTVSRALQAYEVWCGVVKGLWVSKPNGISA